MTLFDDVIKLRHQSDVTIFFLIFKPPLPLANPGCASDCYLQDANKK